MTNTSAPLPMYITLRLDVLSGLMKDVAEHAHQKRDGVSVREVRLLLQVSDNPGLTMSRLVELSFMEKTMVSKAVTSLTRAGLIRRHIDAADARKISLELTRKGKGAADRARQYVLDSTDAVMSRLTPVQRTSFEDALGVLTEHLLHQKAQGVDLLDNPIPAAPSARARGRKPRTSNTPSIKNKSSTVSKDADQRAR
jgi:DNA-binding MarR family transcriptional regulator